MYMTFVLINLVKLLHTRSAIPDHVNFIIDIKDVSVILAQMRVGRFYRNVGSHEADYHHRYEV